MSTPAALRDISDQWFLQEPALFALFCQQQFEANPRMECAFRCGQGRLEYNPLLLRHKNFAEREQLLRVEMIRLYLKHPYERQPEGCSREAMSIGSDITIGDGYCLLHKEKLPVRDPAFYHLPLGQYYEWYAKQIQRQNQDSHDRDDDPSRRPQPADRDKSQLWRDDEMQRQRINLLIERTTDWGTLPGDVVERIVASTRARIDQRLIWQGFHSSVLSSRRHLTRMRPNRRTEFLQMGSTRQFDTRLLCAIDTSGSITPEALADFYSAVSRVFRYGVVQIDVCQFDAALGPIVEMQRAPREVTVRGRGGTSYQPLFDFLLSHPHTYDGCLILTDGQAPPPSIRKAETGVASPLPPILWVCHDRASYEASLRWMRLSGRCCHL